MHRLNRAAFFNLDTTSPLLRLYSRLVALELTLKDHDKTNYACGHDLTTMVGKLPGAGLAAKAIALDLTLTALRRTAKDGNAGPVNPKKYPDLRYLRHETDFPGTTTDADLTNALDALDELLEELKREKVQPC